MKRRFCQIVSDEDLDQAEADIRDWGYPRALVAGERENSVFLGFGIDLITWLNADGGTGLNWHLVIDPKSRGRFSAKEVDRYFCGLDTIAELLGATHLQATLTSSQRKLRIYCARRGWSENDRGYIRSLED